MDISPDGSFLVVLDRGLSAVYRVDTTTGVKTTFFYSTSGMDGLLFDPAVLSDGTALFTQNFNGSGWVALKVLDFGTGVFTPGAAIDQSTVLSRSPTGQYVFIGEENSSGGPVDMYKTGTGIVAHSSDGGFNWGIQAFSGTLAATYVYSGGIYIYDSALHGVVTLTTWNNGAVSDLAFSPDSQWLYILNNQTDSIIKVSTSDWLVKETIPVGTTVGGWLGQVGGTNGSHLIVDPQLRYFTVVTDHSLEVVHNPDAPPIEHPHLRSHSPLPVVRKSKRQERHARGDGEANVPHRLLCSSRVLCRLRPLPLSTPGRRCRIANGRNPLWRPYCHRCCLRPHCPSRRRPHPTAFHHRSHFRGCGPFKGAGIHGRGLRPRRRCRFDHPPPLGPQPAFHERRPLKVDHR
jgi:hypothetical protein